MRSQSRGAWSRAPALIILEWGTAPLFPRLVVTGLGYGTPWKKRDCPLFRVEYGAPGRIRIPNLLIRSQVLYPVELRALS